MTSAWEIAFREAVKASSEKIHADLSARRQAIERDRESKLKEASEPGDRIPLSPANWIENEYFSGPLARFMWPKLKEQFIDICDRKIFEVYLAGAIGWGKSALARALQLRSLYLLSCKAMPHMSFVRPLIPTTPIVLVNLNTTEKKAKRAHFIEFSSLVKSTPYYQREFSPRKGLLNILEFPRMVQCFYAGASKTAAESENMVFCVLDEINLYDYVERSTRAEEGGVYDEASVVHHSARVRMMSRFMHPGDGSFPEGCMLISLCKETYKDSFMRRRIKEVRDDGLDKDMCGPDGKVVRRASVAVLEYSNWDLWPTEKMTPGKFWIVLGTSTEAPRIIEDFRRASEEKKRVAAIPAGVEKPEIVEVPLAGGEMKREAEKNLEVFIRDMCGKATDAINPYIWDKRIIFDSIRKMGRAIPGFEKEPTADVFQHPFTAPDTDGRDGVTLVESLLSAQIKVKDALTGVESMEWRPHIAPEAPRFMHFDVGLSRDSAGAAMACAPAWLSYKEPVGTPGVDGKPQVVDVVRPLIWFDFMMRFVPPRGGQVNLSSLVALVVRLRQIGFNIVRVTFDQFQSAKLIQEFQAMGIEAEILSVDVTTDPYFGLRKALTEGRVSHQGHPVFVRELGKLEVVRSSRKTLGKVIYSERVDHPVLGSKDVADAACGAMWNVETRALEHSPAIGFVGGEARDAVVERHGRMLKQAEDIKAGKFERVFDQFEKGGGRW